MASTNKTENYLLSQFVATDKPSWLSDYNGDMLKIDTALKQLADDVDAVEVSIASLSSDVASNTSSINTLNTSVGTNTTDITDLKAQDIIIKNDITNLGTRVSALENADTSNFELLWENNSTGSFAPQTVNFTKTINSDDLVLLIWGYTVGHTDSIQSMIIPVGCKHASHWFERATIYQRDFTINTNSLITGDCYQAPYNGSSWSTNNNFLIPLKIYRIKK